MLKQSVKDELLLMQDLASTAGWTLLRHTPYHFALHKQGEPVYNVYPTTYKLECNGSITGIQNLQDAINKVCYPIRETPPQQPDSLGTLLVKMYTLLNEAEQDKFNQAVVEFGNLMLASYDDCGDY